MDDGLASENSLWGDNLGSLNEPKEYVFELV